MFLHKQSLRDDFSRKDFVSIEVSKFIASGETSLEAITFERGQNNTWSPGTGVHNAELSHLPQELSSQILFAVVLIHHNFRHIFHWFRSRFISHHFKLVPTTV